MTALIVFLAKAFAAGLLIVGIMLIIGMFVFMGSFDIRDGLEAADDENIE